ncbi:hypothetical protein BV20DRAFT_1035648 [Pilatotrama ljubarskyi]|nr:hypothetical protein BV20DRAFT_1035648 [Pilatotrama ljubarskyi]
MTSTTPTSSSSSPPAQSASSGPPGPSQTAAGQNGQFQGTGPSLTSSASLYSTLILLLLVSATIIARSYVIRRRHRALVAEAIANGTLVPPVKVRLGKKPKMYQVSLVPEVEEDVPRGEKGGGGPSSIEKEKRKETGWDALVVEWNRIMPVSCRLLRPPRPQFDSSSSSSSSIAPPTPSRFARWRRWHWPGRGHRQAPTPSPASTNPASPRTSSPQSPQPPADPRPSSTTMRVLSPDPSEKTARSPTPASEPAPSPTEERARVVVLICMPFAVAMANKKASEYGRAPELPYMEFGVCSVPLERPFDPPVNLPASSLTSVSLWVFPVDGDGHVPRRGFPQRLRLS